MGKVLSLRNHADITFTDSSTVTDMVTVVESFTEVDALREKFTEENLKGATFDGESFRNVVPVGVTTDAEITGNITVHFINRVKTHDELVDEQLMEIQTAMMEMIDATAMPAEELDATPEETPAEEVTEE